MDAGTKCGKGTTFLLVISNSIYSRYNSIGDSLSYRLLGCWIHFCHIKSILNGKLENFQQPALKKKTTVFPVLSPRFFPPSLGQIMYLRTNKSRLHLPNSPSI